MTSKEEQKLDNELSELQIDVESNIYAIINDSTVTIDGKYVPNSKVAVTTAKKLLRISEILAIYEKEY
jgi:hypothetical protein